NDPRAHVYADATWLGQASQETFAVSNAFEEIRVVSSAIATWGVPAVRVPATRTDTLFVDAQFPYAYRLEATPYKASVYLQQGDGRAELGMTPVLLSRDEPLSGTLQFVREGFATVELTPGSDFWNRHQAVMQPLEATAQGAPEVRLDVETQRRRWIDYSALAVAAVGGALAVHYKSEADKRFDLYAETGDPALRPRIERLDNQSAIALGAMQTGIGIFALRLVFGN
ncbi:MAG: hypothetical protein HKN29_06690, partial [Rhodothermales bacterium]|nr:hypothetical protein [Rhodothermales bacterium]